MIKRLSYFFALLLGVGGFAGAAVAAETVYYYQSNSKTVFAAPTGAEVCSWYWANQASQTTIDRYNFTGYGKLPNYNAGCNGTLKSNGTAALIATVYSMTCSGSTPYYDYTLFRCTATAPTQPEPPAPTCTAGSLARVTYKKVDSKGNVLPSVPLDAASDGQCKLKLVDVKSCVLATDDAVYCTYIGERTGDPLPTSDKVPAPTAEMPAKPGEEPVPTNAGSVKDGTACPKGTAPAGFGSDGLISCVGTGSAPKNPSAAPPTATTSATTTNPDGSTTTTTTTVKTNADGSKTTTVDKVTTPAGGGGTVTKEQTKDTSATPSGAAGKETPEKPQEQVNFCKQNPNLAVCRESSVSGTCGQTACTGDAVQCATLAAARAMECKQRSDEDAIKSSKLFNDGQAAANGNDPMQGSLPAPGNGEKLVVPELNADGWLGGGAPMPDVSFTIQGRTITVPISKATEYLVALRYALMVVASLISFRMLSGSILKE